MCGLTLLPRNVLPTIFFVLMSMKAISLLSRFTIITTDVGSVTFTVAACRRAFVMATPAARARAPSPAIVMRFATDMFKLPSAALKGPPSILETRLDADRRDQEPAIGFARHAFELMLQ